MRPCPCARAGSEGVRAKAAAANLSASLAHAAQKHAPPEAASARAVSAPSDVAVPAPSAVFWLPKPNQSSRGALLTWWRFAPPAARFNLWSTRARGPAERADEVWRRAEAGARGIRRFRQGLGDISPGDSCVRPLAYRLT